MLSMKIEEREAALLPPSMHPFADLLRMPAAAIHARYAREQHLQFFETVDGLLAGHPDPAQALPLLRDLGDAAGMAAARARVDRDLLCGTFERLHRHVLGHPVWLHPFFVRFAEGELTPSQMARFLRQYLNQIKNTRQCVALALGRLHSLGLEAPGIVPERISEQTQVVLAGILADEYGVAARPTDLDAADGPADGMFAAVTHVELYRRLFSLVGVPLEAQDEPMLPATADNALIQRAVAGDPRFDVLEALASVGMAMEWGVPVFFSMLLRGVLRFADAQGLEVDPQEVEVLTGHVRQDVEHAVGVMLVAALWMRDETDVQRVLAAANAVMAGRYAMMSDMHAHVFDEPCAHLDPARLELRFLLSDRRYADALRDARGTVPAAFIAGGRYTDRPVRLPYAPRAS